MLHRDHIFCLAWLCPHSAVPIVCDIPQRFVPSIADQCIYKHFASFFSSSAVSYLLLLFDCGWFRCPFPYSRPLEAPLCNCLPTSGLVGARRSNLFTVAYIQLGWGFSLDRCPISYFHSSKPFLRSSLPVVGLVSALCFLSLGCSVAVTVRISTTPVLHRSFLNASGSSAFRHATFHSRSSVGRQ